MPSLDFESEKQNFRDYYNENQGLLEGAKKLFCHIGKLSYKEFERHCVVKNRRPR